MSVHLKHTKRLVKRNGRLPFLMVALMTLVFVACSNDDDDIPEFDFPLEGTILTIADIAGNWTATSAEFQLLGVPESLIEIIGLGGSLTLNIQNNGRYTSTTGFPGEADEQSSGQLGFSGSQLVLLDDEDEPGDEVFFNITLTPEDVMVLSGIFEFDFDDDGSFEATEVDFRLIRQ